MPFVLLGVRKRRQIIGCPRGAGTESAFGAGVLVFEAEERRGSNLEQGSEGGRAEEVHRVDRGADLQSGGEVKV